MRGAKKYYLPVKVVFHVYAQQYNMLCFQNFAFSLCFCFAGANIAAQYSCELSPVFSTAVFSFD